MASTALGLDAPLPDRASTARVVLFPTETDPASEAKLIEAEGLVAANRHEAAVELLEEIWPEIRHDAPLALRHRLALSWAEMYRGALEHASEVLAQAEAIVTSPHFDPVDRAEILYRHGCVALKRSDVAEATLLFTRALETNERSPRPSKLLAAHAHEWRSRCHQFQRDWDAARRDAERSLDIATAAGDEPSQAHALFQASLVAERQKQWLLSKFYAEQALALYRNHGDLLATARILNNLGGIDFLLGDVPGAERLLVSAMETAAEADSPADVAQAVSSLAQVYLRSGRPAEARIRAERAIAMLTDRPDFLDELGNAQLVVANAFVAEGDTASARAWFDRAEFTFSRLGSASHLAATWIARGDLARSTGEVDAAADLYRRAAESLRDFHF